MNSEMKQFGLLGRKLGHSYSPQIHALLGDYEYRLYETEPDELGDFLERTDLAGMNVTIPYKKAVIPHCAAVSGAAERIGAVNTLVRRADGWHGYNTDYDGFRYMVSVEAGYDVRGKKAVVLGNGGAASAVRTALADMGARAVVTLSRRGALTGAQEDGALPESAADVFSLTGYDDTESYRDADVIVNTTPVGMYPDTDRSVLAPDVFDRVQAVFDLIYNPQETLLVRQARERGLTARNGLSMLVVQAVKASEIFTGAPVPEEKTKAVLKAVHEKMYVK